MLAGLLLGAPPTKIVVSLICLVTLQGLWRGAGELIGLVTSTLLAVLMAPTFGKLFEGMIGGIFRTSGVLNRTISIAVVGLIIIVAGTIAISIAARRYLKARPQLARIKFIRRCRPRPHRRHDPRHGGPLDGPRLEPIAQSQVAADAQPGYVVPDEAKPSNPVARQVISFAALVRDSSLGGAATATNPIEGARLLTLSNDFAAIVRDEDAFNYFMQTPVMQDIKALPSITTAVERTKADPQLTALFNDKGVSADTIRAVLESQTILDIFDHTSAVSDLSPEMDAIIAAIAEAKAKIATDPLNYPIPKRKK